MIRLNWRIGSVIAGTLVILSTAGCAYMNYASEIGLDRDGKTIIVRRGGDFQVALDRAKAGDTITLEAGATFKGLFKLPNKSGSEFITIRSSAADAQLPPPGVRLDPAKYTKLLPKLESNVEGRPVISAATGAHHFRFVAVEFGPTIDGLYNIIEIGSGEEKAVEELPHHIEFDRVWIHGSPIYGQRRGIAANGRYMKIENSYISDIKRKDNESQAILVWTTDGPIEIVNNYLEAAGENVMFGGGGSSFLKLVPTDCVVRDNHMNKPVEWMQQGWIVKNLFEIKNGRRIVVSNNLMTHNWRMGQDGTAILFTTRADNGPASIIEDIQFTGNIVRGAGGGVSILGDEGSGGHNLLIQNNLFDDINGQRWQSAGHFLKLSSWKGLTIENNTIIQSGNITVAYGLPVTKFIFRNNIIYQSGYGFHGNDMAPGQNSIDRYLPGSTVANNVIIGGVSSQYREANLYPTSIRQIGFVDAESGDFRLRKNSPYVNKGFGGKPMGADLDPNRVGRSSR